MIRLCEGVAHGRLGCLDLPYYLRKMQNKMQQMQQKSGEVE